MNLLIITSLISLSSAALLPSKSYIPQNQGPGSNGQYGSHSGPGDTGNRRPQQDAEKNAAIVKQDQKVNEDGSFHYGYETSNGIRSEEIGNPAQTQGGFTYQGDDGHPYTVTYTSGDGGFVPQGDHLPVPPPTPEAILEALRQNERDEAAGIFDDGKYHPDAHGGSQGQGQFGSNHKRPLNKPASGPPPNHQGSLNQNTGYNY